MLIDEIILQYNIRAVFFDFDGTLVDTHDVYISMYTQLFNEFGYSINEDDIVPLFGLKALDIIKTVTNKSTNDIELDKMLMRRKEILAEKYKLARVIDGAFELLNYLKSKNLLLAVITSAMLEAVVKINIYVNDILSFFDLVVTADDISETKPSPKPLLYASKKLAIPPKQCLMIGDSIYDILAAKKAEMRVIGFSSMSQKKRNELERLAPDYVIDTFRELMS
ncbi:MAG: HAD family hydrolase [Candidatus Asgardarchaeia archaeon]